MNDWNMNELIGNMMEATPLVAAARGIGKVGEKAMDTYDLMRAYWQPTTKRKRATDIILPHESYAPRQMK